MDSSALARAVLADVSERLPLWTTHVETFPGAPAIVSSTLAAPDVAKSKAKLFLCLEVSESSHIDSTLATVVSTVSAQWHAQDRLRNFDECQTFIAFVDNASTVSYYECQLAQ